MWLKDLVILWLKCRPLGEHEPSDMSLWMPPLQRIPPSVPRHWCALVAPLGSRGPEWLFHCNGLPSPSDKHHWWLQLPGLCSVADYSSNSTALVFSLCKCLYCRGAGSVALISAGFLPMIFGNFLAVVFPNLRRSQHFVWRSLTLDYGRDNCIFSESTKNPSYSIFFVGVTIDFSQFMRKPRFCSIFTVMLSCVCNQDGIWCRKIISSR